ncbi:hypothetical protein [Dactylosporangium sp. CA-233914]|uniref:hypothetical protein n=1 Tax=Dactylosporangium sp. CA-233914 TaxID=3239934 RepID=UPI003D8C0271
MLDQTDHGDLLDDPIGEMDLTDLDFQGGTAGTICIGTVVVSLFFCSRNTLCGTCGIDSRGCC